MRILRDSENSFDFRDFQDSLDLKNGENTIQKLEFDLQNPEKFLEEDDFTETVERKSPADYLALALTTFGVGYLPFAPGTWGSAVGVLIYLAVDWLEKYFVAFGAERGWKIAQIDAVKFDFALLFFFALTAVGIIASNRAVKIFKNKDPQQAVVDEVAGQFLTFLFVPFGLNWTLIIAGFLLFRLFDILKPYPIDYLQNLPTGLGVVADDLLAGVYAGTCLSIFYAIWISF